MLPFHLEETIDTDSSGCLSQKQAIFDIFMSHIQDFPEESALCKSFPNPHLFDATA